MEQLGKRLTESVDIVKDEYEKGNVSKESIQRLFKDNYINISFIDDIEGYRIKEEAVSLLKMGKTLTLRTNEYGNTIFSIKDNGVGISKEDQKKMFEKFYKGDKSRNTDGNGAFYCQKNR